MRTRLLAITVSLMMAGGCSGAEADETVTADTEVAAMQPDDNDQQLEPASNEANNASAGEPAAQDTSDWSGLADAATLGKLQARMEAFDWYGQRVGLRVIASFNGRDPSLAAGELTFDDGMPAIVIATEDKLIELVGEEAFFVGNFRSETSARMGKLFDQGAYMEGLEAGLKSISQL